MKRFFVMRQFTGVGRRPLFIMWDGEDSTSRYHRRVYEYGDITSDPTVDRRNWSPTDAGSRLALLDPDRWMEIAPIYITEVWEHIQTTARNHDAHADPFLFAARRTDFSAHPRPPIKTSNTKHKIGVPKNKLP